MPRLLLSNRGRGYSRLLLRLCPPLEDPVHHHGHHVHHSLPLCSLVRGLRRLVGLLGRAENGGYRGYHRRGLRCPGWALPHTTRCSDRCGGRCRCRSWCGDRRDCGSDICRHRGNGCGAVNDGCPGNWWSAVDDGRSVNWRDWLPVSCDWLRIGRKSSLLLLLLLLLLQLVIVRVIHYVGTVGSQVN